MLKKVAVNKHKATKLKKLVDRIVEEDPAEHFTKSDFKIPKSLAACSDLLYSIRDKRLELEREVNKLKANETALKDHFINALPKDDATGIRGKLAQVIIQTTDEPTAEDWSKITRHITKTGSFDLLQRRLNNAAIKERWANGKKVPGIGSFKVVSVSCTKIGGKK